ncbi:ATP-binding cassette domain-containing protein [Pelobium sp.]|nr:ATP-binding cassette domain-containing protein [Pelobium sp.]MDA9555779.1 ATP-binding cassette domain-containing protein [Pelobium sp.]
MPQIFEADSISLDFGTRRLLSDIYLKCETGQITGILGRNGQGKTCLMNIIYGNINPTSKSIRFDNITIPQPYKRPDLLTYLPQFNFIPAHLTPKRIFSDFDLDYQEFVRIFPEFETKYRTSINKLSGGQRRLIEVYAIIKSKSQFSMLDEPFSHLMPIQIEKVNELLEIEKIKKGFLITDHMFNYVTSISDNLYVLTDGKTHLIKDIRDIEKLGYAKL